MKAHIFSSVMIGAGATIEDGVIIGQPPHGKKEGEVPTVIGTDAFIRANTIIMAGTTIGNDFQTGPNVFIREHNVLGNNVAVWANTVLNYGNTIGNNVRIHVGCFLEKTTIGSDIFIGPRVTFSDDPHPVMPADFEECWKGATIDDGAIIGAGCVFLPHVHIGKAAVIGAGSVITKDIPDFAVAYGNPARVTKTIEEILCKRCGKAHKPYAGKKEKYSNALGY